MRNIALIRVEVGLCWMNARVVLSPALKIYLESLNRMRIVGSVSVVELVATVADQSRIGRSTLAGGFCAYEWA